MAPEDMQPLDTRKRRKCLEAGCGRMFVVQEKRGLHWADPQFWNCEEHGGIEAPRTRCECGGPWRRLKNVERSSFEIEGCQSSVAHCPHRVYDLIQWALEFANWGETETFRACAGCGEVEPQGWKCCCKG